MPMGPGPTPWIKSYNNPELYLGGYGRGAEVGMAAARLAAAQQEAQARLAAAQAESERDAQIKMQLQQQNAAVEQQKIAIENQYRQTQIGLARQEAEESAKMNQWKISQAANEASSRMRLRQAIEGGEDPIKATMRLGPEAGLPMGAMANLASQKKEMEIPENVKTWTDDKGEEFYWTGSRIVHVPKLREESEGQMSQRDRSQISSIKLDEKAIQSKLDRWDVAKALSMDISTLPPKERPRMEALKREALDLQNQLEALKEQRKKLEGFTAPEAGWKEVAPGWRLRVKQ